MSHPHTQSTVGHEKTLHERAEAAENTRDFISDAARSQDGQQSATSSTPATSSPTTKANSLQPDIPGNSDPTAASTTEQDLNKRQMKRVKRKDRRRTEEELAGLSSIILAMDSGDDEKNASGPSKKRKLDSGSVNEPKAKISKRKKPATVEGLWHAEDIAAIRAEVKGLRKMLGDMAAMVLRRDDVIAGLQAEVQNLRALIPEAEKHNNDSVRVSTAAAEKKTVEVQYDSDDEEIREIPAGFKNCQPMGLYLYEMRPQGQQGASTQAGPSTSAVNDGKSGNEGQWARRAARDEGEEKRRQAAQEFEDEDDEDVKDAEYVPDDE